MPERKEVLKKKRESMPKERKNQLKELLVAKAGTI